MRKLFWVVLVLAVLAVGVDRLADRVAEGIVARGVQDSQNLTTSPDVDITGFPFLTQFARRSYDRVTLRAASTTAGPRGTRVRLRDVAITFRGVRTSQDLSRFTAARGRATATLPYAELGRLVDLTVTYAGNGRVRAGKELEVAGQRVTPSVTISPQLLDGALSLTSSALGDLPAPVAQALQSALGTKVQLTDLPFDVRVTSLAARPGGIRLQLGGRDLRYP